MIPIDPVRYPKAVIALGGNALIRPGDSGTLEEQHRRISQAMAHTADLVAAGFASVITHGNGPMVGHLLLQMECAKALVPPMPLFISDADTEGSLGYLIQQCLVNELHRRGIEKSVATVVTQVLVAADDPAFRTPDKPIGPFYPADEALHLKTERGWSLMEDAGRGWRRVAPSPRPLTIIEQDVISYLLQGGIIVIAAGGGGVPVIRRADGDLAGVEAVIDKDRASAVLAREIAADLLIFLTAEEYVYLDYGRPGRRPLTELNCAAARKYLQEGQFPPGSMGPKMESALDFLDQGGARVLITRPESLAAAMAGRTGTHMFP
ncbi:MAG: carbamate kinase [Deltaproteobacteria bacterium]|nr:MAG: carbamate kinase [Deltaproteobacteria bacterium]